jgi:hypothetical protein
VTPEERAMFMFDKVTSSEGLVFVYASDWTWVFKDGRQLLSQHSIPAEHILDALKIDFDQQSFDDDASAEEFENLV